MVRDAQAILSALQACAPAHRFAAARPLTAGASAETWCLSGDNGSGDCILRLDAGGVQFGLMLGKRLEAQAQEAARQSGAPCAEVLAVFSDDPVLGNGYLMRALPGESLAPRILRDDRYGTARTRLTSDCAQALAAIHATPVDTVAALPTASAHEQIEQLYAQHRQFGEWLPVFDLTCGWLRQNIPDTTQTTLVHGDFRLGNLLVTDTGLSGVLDWEMAHRGDPMEDLGWLCVNAWRFGHPDKPVAGVGQREALYRAYEHASGQSVDDRRVRFWELLGNFKWGVVCQYQAWTCLSGQVPSLERAAIGRRVAETEYDMLRCLREIEALDHAA